MRYAVLSDIHSNLEALTAVLQALACQRIDRLLGLGDFIGYGADPEPCLSSLQGAGVIGVAGNHEWACIGKMDLRWFNESARRAVLWTRDRLGFADLDFLRRLPLTAVEGECTLVHGTLMHPERFEYLVDVAQAIDVARLCRSRLCFVGHTHVPLLVEYDLQRRSVTRLLSKAEELAEARLSGAAHIRYIVNPGSVGQPRDGDARASCAVLDTEAQTLAIHRVAYDVPTAQRKIRQAQLPEFLADRLAVGR
ncbi:MAG: metallophosphoesterase family protein [Candidatus Omnitrophica bacterium]|nr:metallophosphoesterase family protein [Candidatus Omnitrophota bacterium]